MPVLKTCRFPATAVWRVAEQGRRIDSEKLHSEKAWQRIPDRGEFDVASAAITPEIVCNSSIRSNLNGALHGRALRATAAVLSANAERQIAMDMRENGKPQGQIRSGLEGAVARFFDDFAGIADKVDSPVIPLNAPCEIDYPASERSGADNFTTTSNASHRVLLIKLVSVLAAGNVFLNKPPENASSLALELIDAPGTVWLAPYGRINFEAGCGHDADRTLFQNHDVWMVNFLRRQLYGREVAATPSDLVRNSVMKLRKKSPQIVLPNVDRGWASRSVAMRIYPPAGSGCAVKSCILVHEGMADSLSSHMRALAGRALIGNAADPKTQITPIANRRYSLNVSRRNCGLAHAGLRLVLNAPRAVRGKGHFTGQMPASDFQGDARLAPEEIFGPAVAISVNRTLEDAFAEANTTDVVLAANIWAPDVGPATDNASRIKSGIRCIKTILMRHDKAPSQASNGPVTVPNAVSRKCGPIFSRTWPGSIFILMSQIHFHHRSTSNGAD